LTLGRSALDAAAQSQPSAAREADGNAWRENYRQLSPDTRPNIAATARHLAGHMSGSSFDTTLELFLAALAQANSLNMG
jgi:hypothetical protein